MTRQRRCRVVQPQALAHIQLAAEPHLVLVRQDLQLRQARWAVQRERKFLGKRGVPATAVARLRQRE